MSHVYLLNADREVVGRLDPSYQSLKTTRKYAGVSTAVLTISRRVLYADQIVAGSFLYLPDGNEVYRVEQEVNVAEGSAANETMTLAAVSVDGFILRQRNAIPPAGESHDSFTGTAEAAIKHFFDLHAGPSADAARQIPDFTIAPNLDRGIAVQVKGRYASLEAVVSEIAALSGMGWETTMDPDTREITLEVIEGTDRSASVFFDFDFQTMERWTETLSLIDSKTVAIVGGQGEGVDREIVVRWDGVEPTGFDRRETFIDARDVDLGETTRLEQRGDAAVASQSSRRIEAVVHPYGSFRYREHWWNGDIVLARNEARDMALAERVVQVERTWEQSAGAPQIVAALGRPLPTVQEKVQSASSRPVVDYAAGGGGGGGSGNIDGGTPDAVYGGTTSIDGGAP